MSKTMKWPPTPVNGRIPVVEGAEATRTLVTNTLSDLGTQPFNSDQLSMSDQTYRNEVSIRGRIVNTLKRLQPIITVQGINEEGEGEDKTFIIDYVDLETREKGKVTING